ncbi:MAG: transglutaminase-like domain-containing protein [Planctomycetaceae bacterium]
MQRAVVCLFFVAIAVIIGAVLPTGKNTTQPRARVAASDAEAGPSVREFDLTYGATLTDLKPGSKVRVWIPVPQSNKHQTVGPVQTVFPAVGELRTESKYGNQMLYFETKAADTGLLSFSAIWNIERQEVNRLEATDREQLADKDRQLFLAPNQKVPVGTGPQLELLEGTAFTESSIEIARTLYEAVDDHVTYDKSKPGYGNGDVAWVCDSKTGNCTDFHSLFISWARAKNVPARFEIGFPLPEERGTGSIGGYHCWAMFYTDDRGWIPVDISEADKHPEMKDYYFGNLTENRVGFSIGRDIVLEPKQAGPPLNYFVYPYIEVDGQPLDRDHIQLDFRYADVSDKK